MDLITTLASHSSKDPLKTVKKSPAILGIEASYNLRDPQLDFVDYPFTKDNFGFEEHLQVVKEVKPKYTVAPDVEKGLKLKEAIRMADQLQDHAENVIMVPKCVKPEDIPDRFVVGYPNQPKFGSNGNNMLYDFQKAERIHILGGSPTRIFQALHYLGKKSVSCDTSSIWTAGSYGKVWTGGSWTERPDLEYYERVLRSLQNFKKELEEKTQDVNFEKPLITS